MTESIDPDTTIDVRNNPESKAASHDVPSPVSRANAGGPPPKDAPLAGEEPEMATSGTAGGDPLAGITITEEDRDEAVSPDTGPDELPRRPADRS